MQKMYPRTNPAPIGASENSNVIPAQQIEEALRESVLQNAAQIRHEPENTSQVVTDVNSFVQRVAGVSLDQLDDAIVDLRQLRDFLHSEGERIQREISGYLQLNHLAIDSTKSIVDNIVQWKKAAHSTSRASERADFVGSTIPRRRPRPQPRMSLSRRNDLSPVVGGVRVTGQHFAQHVPIADFTFGPPTSQEMDVFERRVTA